MNANDPLGALDSRAFAALVMKAGDGSIVGCDESSPMRSRHGEGADLQKDSHGKVRKNALRAAAEPPTSRTPHRLLKASELIAREIVADIANRELQPDDTLPPEAKMLQQYGVGRATLREAIRLLESQGLISIKQGPRGGPVVGAASGENLARVTTLFYGLAGATYNDLTEATLLFDPLAAEMAARAIKTQAEKSYLSEIASFGIDLSEDDRSKEIKLRDFHRFVFELCRNPIVGLICESLSQTCTEHLLKNTDITPFQDTAMKDHKAMAAAILAGRPANAKKLAYDHNLRLVEHCRNNVPGLLDQLVEWR